ncbi:hypothetical protein QUF75_07395 [Desulfococcaceae bacterium HSG7]|nr:hypothetical protein [Desulfococcaceae bacterium HSG7]
MKWGSYLIIAQSLRNHCFGTMTYIAIDRKVAKCDLCDDISNASAFARYMPFNL